jgi:uncharacterized protein (DUF58 family)
LKYVDWKLFARTDRVFTKQYRESTNMAAQIVVDASRSMAYGGRAGVPKIAYARLIAGALAYLLSNQGDPVGLLTFDERVRQYLPARGGAPHLRAVLLALAALEASGSTAAAGPLRRAIDLMRRRGLVVFISDLYDEDARVEGELKRAASVGHEIALFHVLTRDEVEFPFSGAIEFEDLESRRTALSGASTANVYRRRFGEFLERWHTLCASNGFTYTRVSTDAPLDAALRGYLLKRLAGGGR